MKKLVQAFVMLLAIPASFSVASDLAFAQSEIVSERVSFRSGTSSAVISRTIRGWQTIDFLVNARAGQRLAVSMTSNNSAAYFNILPPGGGDAALYVGENSDPANSYSATLQQSGDHRIRVYLYRAAARRGERANVRISLSVTGRGDTTTQLPGTPPANGGGTASQLPGDALVAGTPFHARGILSCAVRLIGPLGDCNYGVIRQGSGSAAIVVSKLDGRSRTIVYRQGTPIGYDQARGEPARLTWTRQGDEITVRIGNERYVIPDAAVYGG